MCFALLKFYIFAVNLKIMEEEKPNVAAGIVSIIILVVAIIAVAYFTIGFLS